MWTAYLFKMTTGEIGPRLNFEKMTWAIELNGTESMSFDLRKSDLPKVDLSYWLSPWWAGVVLLWDNVPLVAGPIITRPSESSGTVSLGCGGIRSILAKRLVVDEQENWDTLSKTVVSYKGLSLGTIAKKVVQKAQEKASGSLPISYPMADQTAADDADHERNFRGFNLQNITCDDILTKLSNVINGPDIMFKPRLINANHLTFDMWYGTETQPRLAQSQMKVWDTTPVNGEVSGMSTIVTGTYQTGRVFSAGAGQDEGLLIKVETDTVSLQKGYPLLETTINEGNSENPVTVRNHALGELGANNAPLMEVQLTVRADSEIPVGGFWPGDLVEVIASGWLSVRDGTTQMRLLAMSGDETNNVKVNLQPEEKFLK